MTILQALAARYERLAAEGLAPIPGFAPAQISFTLVINKDGVLVAVQDERNGDAKRRRPRVTIAPQAPKRTVGVASGAFWDKTSYVLGRTVLDATVSPARQERDADRLAREHAAFRERHETLLSASHDEGCQALLRFLQNWTPAAYDALDHAEAMLDQNVAFRLEGHASFIHDRPAARAALLAEAAAKDAGASAMCLVTGQTGPVARLHPSIKGVPGAQSSGAALVSFNLDAFTSYGHAQGDNAPVSEAAAFAYGNALNALLTPSGTDANGRPIYPNRVMLGGTTVVFWAETGPAEALASAFFAPIPANEATETKLLRDTLQQMQNGTPLRQAAPELDPATRVYVLGLSPNAARLSVRFWVEQSLESFTANFLQHWDDLRIEPMPDFWPPPLWALLYELAAQRKAENVPQHLEGEFMRAILTGLPYPRSLLAQTVLRIRADQDRQDPKSGRTLEKVSDLRVALLKACLARLHRKGLIPEDVPVSLDPTSLNAAYRLGRMFSVLERLQGAALGQRNATIRDRFYASASATPAQVFPSLLRNARNHSKTIRSRVGAGLAEWFEDHLADIASGLEGAFPKTLPLEEQGRFALGYYHQRDVFRRKKDVPVELDTDDSTNEE